MGSGPAEPDEERRERSRARYARYNASSKGRARDQRYEQAHPERRSRRRWDVMATNRGRGEE